jgi:hypothetical protein
VDTDTLWVLHRGNRIWAADTFNPSNGSEQIADETPIAADTVLQLAKDTGAVLRWVLPGVCVEPAGLAHWMLCPCS